MRKNYTITYGHIITLDVPENPTREQLVKAYIQECKGLDRILNTFLHKAAFIENTITEVEPIKVD